MLFADERRAQLRVDCHSVEVGRTVTPCEIPTAPSFITLHRRVVDANLWQDLESSGINYDRWNDHSGQAFENREH